MLTATDRHGRRIVVRRVVPDGATLHVPISLMDTRAVQTQRAFLRDAGDDPLVLDLMGAPAASGPVSRSRPLTGAVLNALDPTGKVVTTPAEAARQRYLIALSERWKTPAYAKAHKPSPGLAAFDPADAAEDGADAAERSYQRMKARLSDAWRTPTRGDYDDNAEGVSTAGDLPPDIAAMPMAQQLLYCEAYKRWVEEHPDDDDEACDEAGRAALSSQGDSVADAAAHLERVRDRIHEAQKRRLSEAWRQR